jgi:hypothetical protein
VYGWDVYLLCTGQHAHHLGSRRRAEGFAAGDPGEDQRRQPPCSPDEFGLGDPSVDLQARLGHSTANAALLYQHIAKGRDQMIAESLSKMVSE